MQEKTFEIQKKCQERSANYLTAFLSCKLIPLDKQPDVRPFWIGEVLRRVIYKIVIKLLKDILKATESLNFGMVKTLEIKQQFTQFLICSMKMKVVLMDYALNAFNWIKREAFIHNTKVLCPTLATFITTQKYYVQL